MGYLDLKHILGVPTLTGNTGKALAVNGTEDGFVFSAFPSVALTIGTTPLISGTIGRILFQGTGDVVQESDNLFWSNSLQQFRVGGTLAEAPAIKFTSTDNAYSTDFAIVRNANSGNNPRGLQFYNDGAGSTMQLTRNGRVAIGINFDTPSATLDILTAALGTTQTATSGIALTNNTAAAAGLQQISPALRWSGFGWKTDATAASQSVDFRAYVTPVQGTANPTGYLGFGSSINGAAYNDNQLVLTSAGNVGIGTTTPGFKLDVNGDSNVTGTLRFLGDNNIGISAFNGSGRTLFFTGDYNGSALYSMSIGSTYSDGFRLSLNGIERFDVNSSTGNVGISAPVASAKLHVIGTTEQLRLGYDGSNYASFTINSTGSVTVGLTGTTPTTTFSQDIKVPDDAYDATTWNGNVAVPTKNAIRDKIESLSLVSGTYTPTLTNTTNLDASTAYSCQYMRIGNTVTVSGKVNIDPTTAATSTVLGISLPISSNFANNNECAGTAYCDAIAGQGAAIRANATSDVVEMVWIAGDTTAQDMYFTFTYRII